MHLHLRVLVVLGWRNLWRNYRRTAIMLAAITLGVWAMIFMSALMRGMVDDMVDAATRSLLGHVQIRHPLYADDPSIVNSMPPPDKQLLQLLSSPEVVAWGSRVRVPAVISSARESSGVTLLGVDPAQEQKLSFVASSIVAGRFLESLDDRGIIIGKRLAEKLETNLGKRVVLMSQDPHNTIVDRGFTVVGIYRTDPANTEERLVFTARATAQRFLGMGEQITEVEVWGHNYRQPEALAELFKPVVSDQQQVLTWLQQNPYLGSMLDLMDGFILVWMVVIFLALSFGLVNTLIMAVFERIREIGLMQALGMRASAIVLQVLMESLLLLALGLVLGNVLAWLSLIPIQDGIDISAVAKGLELSGMRSVLRPSLLVSDMLMSSAVVLVLGVLASLYPAWRASQYEPVAALNKI